LTPTETQSTKAHRNVPHLKLVFSEAQDILVGKELHEFDYMTFGHFSNERRPVLAQRDSEAVTPAVGLRQMCVW
jgi:hypothetical protein